MQYLNPRVLVSVDLIRFTMKKANLSKISRVLELGVGDGSIVKQIVETLGIHCDIYGVDIDEDALKLAKGKGILVSRADLNEDKLPYPDNYFDLVIMEEVIEHLINPDNAIKEVHRVLKPRGLLVISTPNLGWWVNRLVLLLGFQPYWTEVSTRYNVGKLRRKLNEPLSGHLRLYTLPALTKLLNLYNIKPIECKGTTYNNTPKVINVIDRLLSMRTTLAQILVCIAMDFK